ncbi:asparaginase [Azoarcus communis]|uniref:asparaginase n=1 Tax=Parazoarcus communis TaxID=41977 RepID=UPI001459D842|nr:asparaginase [Parazoarcus communis]NMG48078.1 asparaginase [Parazoarcus communis]
MTPRICILYTGGTFGMKPSAAGYAPDGGLEAALATTLPAAGKDGMPAWDLVEYDRLIDSAEAQPADWHTIAADIAARYADYDGFVVIHGTDTMAYTASALSFALQGLRKPVIVTGSQIPLCEPRNDARNNLTSALLIAARYPVPEVGLFFHDRLLRGNRATKVASADFAAFDSPNHAALARVGINIDINAAAVLPMPRAEHFQVVEPGTQEVAVLRLYPGLSSARLQHLLAQPLAGLVLQTYGAGNGPVAMPGFLDALAAASARGTVIVNLTQCQRGGVDQAKYATGSALAGAGVVGGGDLTVEAAVTKLHHLISCGLEPDAVRRQMPLPLCGECSEPA